MGFETLADIRVKVRSFLTEPEPGFWTNVELNTYINMALRDFGRRGLAVEQRARRQVMPGVEWYPVPTDTIHGKLRHVEFHPADGTELNILKYKPMDVLKNMGMSRGRPRYFSLWRNCIFLRPVPDRFEWSTIPLMADETEVRLELPDNTTILVWTMTFNVGGREPVVVEVVGGNIRATTPDAVVHVIAATASVAGTCAVQLQDGVIRINPPTGADVNWFTTTSPNHHGFLLLRYYGDPEPMTIDADGVEIDDAYIDALVYYSTALAWAKDKETGTANSQFFMAKYESMVVESLVDRLRRQMANPVESVSEALLDWDALI